MRFLLLNFLSIYQPQADIISIFQQVLGNSHYS